ncbi:hypothetical protein [Modestobacter sp. I12A-02662]|uniref:hypothetical protein n=1 Tax=Modestobacter sp. I12A-02662 TaxID=1730496 RepID=UPI0034DEB420
MDGPRRSSRQRRGRARLARAALVVVLAVVGLLAAPGTASAGDDDDLVIPLLTCVTHAEDGRYTAVFGYNNRTSRVVTVSRGDDNNVDPSGPVPEVFQPGVHHGVFSVSTTVDRRVEWELYDSEVRAYGSSQPSCGPEVQMPADGNGTGAVVALAAAGVVGAIAVQRARRRALVGAGAPVRDGGDDA